MVLFRRFKVTTNFKNGATISFISYIITPFSFRNKKPNYYSSKKSTQSQSSKYFLENSIDFEITNLMSVFDIK